MPNGLGSVCMSKVAKKFLSATAVLQDSPSDTLLEGHLTS